MKSSQRSAFWVHRSWCKKHTYSRQHCTGWNWKLDQFDHDQGGGFQKSFCSSCIFPVFPQGRMRPVVFSQDVQRMYAWCTEYYENKEILLDMVLMLCWHASMNSSCLLIHFRSLLFRQKGVMYVYSNAGLYLFLVRIDDCCIYDGRM